MRFSLLLLSLLFTLNSFADTSTPRETFRTFLKAMVEIKTGQGDTEENYEEAISTLDLSSFSAPQKTVGIKLSNDLIQVLDKIKKVDYELIPQEPSDPFWIFDQRSFNESIIEISLVKKDKSWLFSQKTLNSLPLYKKALKDHLNIAGVVKLNRVEDQIKALLPVSFQGKLGPIAYWQLLALLILILVAFIIEKLVHFLIEYLITHTSKIVNTQKTDKLDHAIKPASKIIFVYVIMKGIIYLDLTPSLIIFLERVLLITMSFMSVWFGHRVVELFNHYALVKAERTDAKFDDIFVPLLTKSAFVFVYIVGILIVASAFTIDITGLVAGLGIGGLAFAFAAKDTLANFFGSIMLVLDRPFDIGDIITSGEITGVVAEVGFRSTRIRTFNDSLITISNGELMNRPIDNQGKRRFRRLSTTLGLEYDTPPSKIEAFCEGIRQLIVTYKWTRKDSFHVYFDGFGDSALNIKMVVYWETDDYAREMAEKHRLNIDILRLAKEIGVDFAFPTQTVHMFQENSVDQVDIPEKYLELGIEKAIQLAKKPLSLKNPRSNSQDQEQFGKNDIGN